MKKLITLTAFALLTGSAFSATITQYLKLTITENPNTTVQLNNSMTFAFSTDGLDGFDAGDAGNQNSFGTSIGNEIYPFSLNSDGNVVAFQDSRPDLFSYTRIKMGFYSKFAATIKITASAFGNTADSSYRPSYAWLEQISTGLTFSILNDTASITIPADIDFTADFYLHTGPYIKVSSSDETCFQTVDGVIGVDNPNYAGWLLTVYNGASIVFSDSIYQPDTTLQNIIPGNYTAVVSINSIPVVSSLLIIHAAPQLFPGFTVDIAAPTTDDIINFTNTSSGTVAYFWDFGNGDNDTQDSTSYQYPFAGSYVVSLTATSETGCQATVYDSITVTQGIGAPQLTPMISNNNSLTMNSTFDQTIPDFDATIYSADAKRIMLTQAEPQNLHVMVLTTSGQVILEKESNESTIALDVQSNGIYIVKVVAANGATKTKTIMVAN